MGNLRKSAVSITKTITFFLNQRKKEGDTYEAWTNMEDGHYYSLIHFKDDDEWVINTNPNWRGTDNCSYIAMLRADSLPALKKRFKKIHYSIKLTIKKKG